MQVKLNAITQPIITGQECDMEDGGLYHMKPEEYMIYCARVSSPENRLNHETAPKLLRYLIDAGHWSPFEMISLGFEIETSRAIAQQILRHRSFSFQEFSQRYAQVSQGAVQIPELRYTADKNRQSSENIANRPELDREGQELIKACFTHYEKLISQDIATECARFFLPLCTTTTIVMHGTLRSWIHFLDQRCDDHAQKEIRLIAETIKEQLSEVCPWTGAALEWTDA